MNYDNLFGKDYVQENLLIEDKISVNFAKDSNDEIIGIKLDFEYADDYHYKFLIEEWNKLMNCLFNTIEVDEYIEKLKEYFKTFNLYSFQQTLTTNNIDYKKIAFY